MNMVMQTKKIPKNSIETLIKNFKKIKSPTKKDKVFLLAFLSALDIKDFTKIVNFKIDAPWVVELYRKRIDYDLSFGTGVDEYSTYFNSLLGKINDCDFQRKRLLMAIINQELQYLNDKLKYRFIYYCMTSNNKIFRKYVWKNAKILQLNNDKLISHYYEFRDREILYIIYELLNKKIFVDFFKKNLDAFLEEEWLFRKVYKERYEELPIIVHEKVRLCEPETFLYTRAILKKNISDGEALDIYNRSSKKLLVVWCLGKLAKIDILNKIYKKEKYDNRKRTDAGE